MIEKFKTKAESDKSFLVPFAEIKENDYNLSPQRYKKIEYEEVEYEKPEVIIERVLKEEEEIRKELKELKGMMK